MAAMSSAGLLLACCSLLTVAAIKSDVSGQDAGCTITARACRNFPGFARTQFRDRLGEEYTEAAENEAACLKRAEDFHHWCGNTADDGAQVAATYNPKQWTQVYHPGACENGWSEWDAFCYKYFWEMATWPEAEARCRQCDSHLVSIHSQAENRFVATLQHGLKGWIGYSDVDKDTHYEWSDNTNDDFTNFAKNCSGRESEPDCQKSEVQQQWYTSTAESRSPYTCKRNVLVPGLALLRNVSAQRLLDGAWSSLLPALASGEGAEPIAVASAGDGVAALPRTKDHFRHVDGQYAQKPERAGPALARLAGIKGVFS